MPSSSSSSSSLGLALFATTAAGVLGYVAYQRAQQERARKDPSSRIYATKDDVARQLCALVVEQAQEAIAQRGVFYFAVAGGSLLDVLTHLTEQQHKNAVDWSKVVVCFANHKCVPPTSEKATLFKCQTKFAKALGITRFVTPTDQPATDSDGSAEAKYYAKALIASDVPHRAQYPLLDLVLLGLGADGHVGSCHPGGPAVLNTTDAVAGSPKLGEPSSITLTIEALNAARQTCVVVCGGSKGKKEAVKRALQRPAERPRGTFPAQSLEGPIFFLDEEAAADLQ